MHRVYGARGASRTPRPSGRSIACRRLPPSDLDQESARKITSSGRNVMNSLLKSTIAVSLFSLLALSANAQGDNTATQGGPPVLAKELAPARFGTTLRVTSSAFSSGGEI